MNDGHISYERMRQSLAAAEKRLHDKDRALLAAPWLSRDLAVAVALQLAIEAKVFASRSILECASLAETNRDGAITALARLFRMIQPELLQVGLECRPQDVVALAHTRIDAFTAIDETNGDAKIALAERFVQSTRRLLTEVLPGLVIQGLQGWDVLPPEDPAGGSYR